MEKKINKIVKANIIPEVLLIALAFILYFCRDLTAITMSYLIFAFVLVKGIGLIISGDINKQKIKMFKYNTLFGIFSLLFSLFLILNIFIFKINLNVPIGIYFVGSGLINLALPIFAPKTSKQAKALIYIITIIIIGLGIVFCFDLLSDLLFFNRSTGILFGFYGILNSMVLLIIKKNIKKIK